MSSVGLTSGEAKELEQLREGVEVAQCTSKEH
jgi:hypothetical protein